MRKILLISLIISLIICTLNISTRYANSQENYIKIYESGDDFKLYYYISGNVIFFKMESKTTGYLAIGFDPSSYMKDADMVLGYVSNDKVFIIDAYSTGNFGPHPEDTTLGGEDNILEFSGSENGGITSIEFSRYLDTNDKYDKVLHLDKSIKFIWSISSSDSFNSKHSKRGAGTIIIKSADVVTQPSTKKVILSLTIGSNIMIVNDNKTKMDVAPFITEGRTLLPIRWIAEPLGATVSWDSTERKVTVALQQTKIELWIGKSLAKINSKEVQIDSQNSKVVPVIVDGRTMLPVRFVAESIGCDVQWDNKTKTVIITYPK